MEGVLIVFVAILYCLIGIRFAIKVTEDLMSCIEDVDYVILLIPLAVILSVLFWPFLLVSLVLDELK